MAEIHDMRAMMEAIKHKVFTYSTLIIGAGEGKPFAPIGTGTLVLIEGRHSLLTAAHVWEAVERFPRVALVNASNHPSAVAENRDLFTKRFVTPYPKGDAIRFGPDLALLEVPAPYARRLEATGKAFYNLSKRRAERLESPLDTRAGWVIVGALIDDSFERRGTQPDGAEQMYTDLALIWSRVRATHERRGFDYIDLALDNKLSGDFPLSYGGVSGAGLWRVGKRDGDRLEWPDEGPVELEGVVFLYHAPQPEPEDEVIRSHGRRSVYDVAIASSGLLPSVPPKE